MNTGSIHQGDIVKCNVRGDTFYALVEAKGRSEDARLAPRELSVNPISIGRSAHRIVTPRQITHHWRKSRQSRS